MDGVDVVGLRGLLCMLDFPTHTFPTVGASGLDMFQVHQQTNGSAGEEHDFFLGFGNWRSSSSNLWRWNNRMRKFTHFQEIPFSSLRSMHAISFNGEDFLVLLRIGTAQLIPWDVVTRQFDVSSARAIADIGSSNCGQHFVTADGQLYFVAVQYSKTAVLLKWAPSSQNFVKVHDLSSHTHSASGVDVVQTEQAILVVVVGSGGSLHKWNPSLEQLEFVQQLAAGRRIGETADHIFIDGALQIGLAFKTVEGGQDPSIIYSMSVSDLQVTVVQEFPEISGASDIEFFQLGSEYFAFFANKISFSNSYSTESLLYKWSARNKQWLFHQSIATFGGISADHITVNGVVHLAVANQYTTSTPSHSATYSVNSSAFIFNGCTFNEKYDDSTFVDVP